MRMILANIMDNGKLVKDMDKVCFGMMMGVILMEYGMLMQELMVL